MILRNISISQIDETDSFESKRRKLLNGNPEDPSLTRTQV